MEIIVEAYDLNLSYAGPCSEYIEPDCCVTSGKHCSVDY